MPLEPRDGWPCKLDGGVLGLEQGGGSFMRIQTVFLSSLAVVLFSAGGWARGRGHGGREAGKSNPGLRGSTAGASRGVQEFSRRGSIRTRTPGSFAQPLRYRASSPRFNTRYSFGSKRYRNYGYLPYFAQSYGWPGFNYGSPYAYSPYSWNSPYSSYRYFYDLYYGESLRSKQEADEFEASFARERGNQPAASSGADERDDVPLAPRDLKLTVDGQEHKPSASGAPLVLGSGHHTVRISAKP